MGATTTIPIVMVTSGAPVEAGLVQSLARPGGNVTGIGIDYSAYVQKQLQMLRDVAPQISRLAVLWNSGNPGTRQAMDALKPSAETMNLYLIPLDVKSASELGPRLASLGESRPEALVCFVDPIFNLARALIVQYANAAKLVAVYPLAEFVQAGGLMSYGANFGDLYYRSIEWVSQILKDGKRPQDLPVRTPEVFDTCVNEPTARAIGVTLPLSLLPDPTCSVAA
jgi:putative ABC transport system substrate-binding protein